MLSSTFKPTFLCPDATSLPQDCSVADCLRFRCDIRSFGVQEELDFILKGNLSFGWVSQVCPFPDSGGA